MRFPGKSVWTESAGYGLITVMDSEILWGSEFHRMAHRGAKCICTVGELATLSLELNVLLIKATLSPSRISYWPEMRSLRDHSSLVKWISIKSNIWKPKLAVVTSLVSSTKQVCFWRTILTDVLRPNHTIHGEQKLILSTRLTCVHISTTFDQFWPWPMIFEYQLILFLRCLFILVFLKTIWE